MIPCGTGGAGHRTGYLSGLSSGALLRLEHDGSGSAIKGKCSKLLRRPFFHGVFKIGFLLQRLGSQIHAVRYPVRHWGASRRAKTETRLKIRYGQSLVSTLATRSQNRIKAVERGQCAVVLCRIWKVSLQGEQGVAYIPMPKGRGFTPRLVTIARSRSDIQLGQKECRERLFHCTIPTF